MSPDKSDGLGRICQKESRPRAGGFQADPGVGGTGESGHLLHTLLGPANHEPPTQGSPISEKQWIPQMPSSMFSFLLKGLGCR